MASSRGRSREISEKIIRSTMKNKNWGWQMQALAFSMIFYLFLHIAMGLTISAVINSYMEDSSRGFFVVKQLSKSDFELRSCVQNINQMYALLVAKNTNLASKAETVYRKVFKSDKYPNILEDSIMSSVHTGHTNFETFLQLVMSDDSFQDRETTGFIFNNKVPWNAMLRQGGDPKEKFKNIILQVPVNAFIPTALMYIEAIEQEIHRLMYKPGLLDMRDKDNITDMIIKMNENIVDAGFDIVQGVLEQLSNSIIKRRFITYRTSYLWFTIGFSIVAAVNLASIAFTINATTNRMRQVLSCYSLLRQSEVEVQQESLEHMIEVFSQFKFHEEILIEEFFNLTKKKKKTSRETRSGTSQTSQLGGQMHTKSRRWAISRKVVPRGRFWSNRIAHITNFVLIAVFALVIFIVYTFQTNLDNSNYLMNYTIDTYMQVINVANNILALDLYIAFGGIFKIQDKPINSNQWRDSPGALVKMWTQSFEHLKEIVDHASAQRLLSMQYDNLCTQDPGFRFDNFTEVCPDLLSSSLVKGSIQSMYRERSIVSDYFDKTDLFRVNNSTQDQGFQKLDPFSDGIPEIFFEQDLVEVRLAHDFVSHLAVNNTFASIETNIARLADTERYFMQWINYNFVVLLAVFLTITNFAVLYLIKMDYEICFETFKVIFPDIILANPYLLNKFKTFFKYSVG